MVGIKHHKNNFRRLKSQILKPKRKKKGRKPPKQAEKIKRYKHINILKSTN